MLVSYKQQWLNRFWRRDRAWQWCSVTWLASGFDWQRACLLDYGHWLSSPIGGKDVFDSCSHWWPATASAWILAVVDQSRRTGLLRDWHLCGLMGAPSACLRLVQSRLGAWHGMFCDGSENGGCSQTALTLCRTRTAANHVRALWPVFEGLCYNWLPFNNTISSYVDLGKKQSVIFFKWLTSAVHDLVYRQGTKLDYSSLALF